MITVSNSFFNRRTRFRSALGPLDALAESFVIRVEVEKKLIRIDAVTGLVCLQHCFEEPRGVSDVPSRRTHEVSRLDHVVFDFEWCDDLHRARANVRVEIRDRNGLLPCKVSDC